MFISFATEKISLVICITEEANVIRISYYNCIAQYDYTLLFWLLTAFVLIS